MVMHERCLIDFCLFLITCLHLPSISIAVPIAGRSGLVRVMWPFSWFYRPSFVCLCKSPVPIFPPCSLKLEDGQLVPSCLPTKSNGRIERGKGEKSKQGEIVLLKSSLKKGDGSPPKEEEDAVRRRVQWMDFTGKELAQVREYEPSVSGNSCDDGGSRGCFCVIQ